MIKLLSHTARFAAISLGIHKTMAIIHIVAADRTAFQGVLSDKGPEVLVFSNPAISGARAADYEINTTLAITPNSGTYILLFRTGSASVESGAGNYLSVELNSLSDGLGSVVVNQSVSGTLSQISSTSIHITNGMTFRATIQGTALWV